MKSRPRTKQSLRLHRRFKANCAMATNRIDALNESKKISGSGEARIYHSHPLSPGRVKRTVRLGFRDLWNNRLRSLLTMLGIVFGVCSVIAMLAIGEGAKFEAQAMILQLGSNNIIVRSVKTAPGLSSSGTVARVAEYGLTYEDVDRIRETIPGVTVKVPARILHKDVWNGMRNLSADLYGTVPWYPEVNNHRVIAGRFFSKIEFENKINVCVISADMARELFPLDSPLGQTVRTGAQYYSVIGVMEPKSLVDVTGGDGSARRTANVANGKDASGGKPKGAQAGHRVFLPLSTMRELFGDIFIEYTAGSRTYERVLLNEAIIQVARVEDVIATSGAVEEALAFKHPIKDYEVIVPLAQLEVAERQNEIFNIVLGGIAALSMLVGGIGIMNIMLASVTERTREVGIRRALGAKRRDILTQFLVETVILSSFGGLTGVVLGIVIAVLIEIFADMPTIVTFWSPLMAFSISALVGVIFGIYPAMRAADMNPIEALRHE
jgi:putative ABC transport system permease protein